MHYLPNKKLRESHEPGYGPDCLAGIGVNHGLSLTQNFVCSFRLFFSRSVQDDQNEASELP